MAKGFDVLDVSMQRVDYILVERDDKTFAEPVDIPRGSGGLGVGLDAWWPLEDTACSDCGVYGLVSAVRIGEYACANCGSKCILAPSYQLHIVTP